MAEDRTDLDARPGPAPEDDEHPRGTFFLTLVFLLMIAGAWFWMYATLIGRT